MQTVTQSEPRFAPHIQAMLDRADHLFADGYWAEATTPNVVTVTTPEDAAGRSRRYEVHLVNQSCQCEAFRGGRIRTRDGRRACKHLVGVFLLVSDCEARLREIYEQAAAAANATADRYGRHCFHMGGTLVLSFGKTPDNQIGDNAKRAADLLLAVLAEHCPRPRETTRQAA